jgi:putative FmdB family regulatory protein
MPRYTYECEICEEVFDLVHSMNDKPKSRKECENSCVLKKIPSNLTILNSNTKDTTQKAGAVVKDSIEEFKDDLKQEQKRLKSVYYEKEND